MLTSPCDPPIENPRFCIMHATMLQPATVSLNDAFPRPIITPPPGIRKSVLPGSLKTEKNKVPVGFLPKKPHIPAKAAWIAEKPKHERYGASGMRRAIKLALALAVVPFMATAAAAAPATPNAASALSKVDAGSGTINVRKGGGYPSLAGHGGGGHFGGGGHGGGHHHGGHGPGHGGGGHWHGGGGHWHGGHHHHFRPRWYGVPYYYDYGPSYYYDDDYDDDDDAVVYSDSGDAVARCEARYRSFDRRTGTFLSNDGRRKVCPYLR